MLLFLILIQTVNLQAIQQNSINTFIYWHLLYILQLLSFYSNKYFFLWNIVYFKSIHIRYNCHS